MRVVVVVSVLAIAPVAIAEDIAHDLAKARELEAALDYAGALRIVDQALARGGSDTFQYVELHVLAGKLAAGLDRRAEAEAHFARVLALRPDAVLPDGTSPKLTAPFDAAKARSVPLKVRATAVRGLITLVREADPLGLVAGISVAIVDGAGAHRDVVDRRATRIAIPAGTTALEVTALDADGHRIWSGTPEEAIETRRPAEPDGPSWITRWPTWAVVTGLALGAGGVAAWRMKVAQDEFDDLRTQAPEFDDLHAIEQRGDRWALAANISFGVAAVAGVVTTVLYVKQREPSVLVGASAGSSSAAISIGGRF